MGDRELENLQALRIGEMHEKNTIIPESNGGEEGTPRFHLYISLSCSFLGKCGGQ